MNKLFNLNLGKTSLIKLAGVGEKSISGSIHYDNVAASILGGFVVVKTNPLNIIKIEPPKDLIICIAIPEIKTKKNKTKISRDILPSKINFKDSIYNLSNATQMVIGFMKGDIKMIGMSMCDNIVEPIRKQYIHGFSFIKKNMITAGAIGVTISGAGPTIVAITNTVSSTKKICNSITNNLDVLNKRYKIIVCKPSNGATIINYNEFRHHKN